MRIIVPQLQNVSFVMRYTVLLSLAKTLQAKKVVLMLCFSPILLVTIQLILRVTIKQLYCIVGKFGEFGKLIISDSPN